MDNKVITLEDQKYLIVLCALISLTIEDGGMLRLDRHMFICPSFKAAQTKPKVSNVTPSPPKDV